MYLWVPMGGLCSQDALKCRYSGNMGKINILFYVLYAYPIGSNFRLTVWAYSMGLQYSITVGEIGQE